MYGSLNLPTPETSAMSLQVVIESGSVTDMATQLLGAKRGANSGQHRARRKPESQENVGHTELVSMISTRVMSQGRYSVPRADPVWDM
jgi:hypothetical protein